MKLAWTKTSAQIWRCTYNYTWNCESPNVQDNLGLIMDMDASQTCDSGNAQCMVLKHACHLKFCNIWDNLRLVLYPNRSQNSVPHLCIPVIPLVSAAEPLNMHNVSNSSQFEMISGLFTPEWVPRKCFVPIQAWTNFPRYPQFQWLMVQSLGICITYLILHRSGQSRACLHQNGSQKLFCAHVSLNQLFRNTMKKITCTCNSNG